MVNRKKAKKEKEKPKVCYFCLWNDPVAEIKKGAQVLLACKYCYNIMQPLTNSESGVWGWTLASIRPIHPDAIPFQDKPMLRCPNCTFKSVSEDSMMNHKMYTHRPNHLYTPNVQTEASKQDWLKKMGHRW
jgi:hypothetical protein